MVEGVRGNGTSDRPLPAKMSPRAKLKLDQPHSGAVRRSKEVHQAARGVTVSFFLERHVKIRGYAQHVHQAPKSETRARVFLQPEIDPKLLLPGRLDLRRSLRKISCAEIPLQEIVEFHPAYLAGSRLQAMQLRPALVGMRQFSRLPIVRSETLGSQEQAVCFRPKANVRFPTLSPPALAM